MSKNPSPQQYSSSQQISDFVERVATTADASEKQSPLMVLDMDGNVIQGFNIVKGKELPTDYPTVDGSDNRQGVVDPAKQTIPFDADIDALIKAGIVEPALFASAPMDVRMPKELVDAIQESQKNGTGFEIAILTSRGMEDAELIAKASGITTFDNFTFLADSGATAYIAGDLKNFPTTPEEKAFTQGIDGLRDALVAAVEEIVGTDTKNKVLIEQKTPGLATNVHWRQLLDELGLEGQAREAMDATLRDAVKEVLAAYVEQHSPQKEDGKPLFSLLNGPETLEVKQPAVDKGKGLEYIVEEAQKAGVTPSAIIYAGDDVAKTKGEEVVPGTDYKAFKAGLGIEEQTGIPFFTIHTLHPADKSLTPADIDAASAGIIADDTRRIRPITAEPDERVKADITTASPLQTGKIVLDVVQAVEQRLQQDIQQEHTTPTLKTSPNTNAHQGQGLQGQQQERLGGLGY